MKFTLKHKKMTEEKILENLKYLHQQYPDIFLSPEEWKEMRKDYD